MNGQHDKNPHAHMNDINMSFTHQIKPRLFQKILVHFCLHQYEIGS